MKRLLAILISVLLGAACSFRSDEPAGEEAPPKTPREIFRDANGRTVAVQAGPTLYLSAIEPADPDAPVAAQTQSAMERLGEALGLAGLDFPQVASCHVHLADMGDYAEMNGVYGSYFPPGQYPARTTLELPGLPGNSGVLLACIAYAGPEGLEIVRPPESELPAAMGPYSPAVRAGRTVYLSGQGGRDPATGELPEAAGEQAERTWQTIETILRAAGLSPDNVALASAYLPPATAEADIDPAFEARFSPGGAASRANVALSGLPGGIAVEITAIAIDDAYITRLFMPEQAPTALSSPASLSGEVLYASPLAGTGATFRAQYLHALQLQTDALRLALMEPTHAVRVIAYLRDIGRIGELRALLGESFPDGPPATTIVQARTPADAEIALEFIAVR